MEKKDHGDNDGFHVLEINNGDIAFVVAEEGVLDDKDTSIDFNEKVSQVPDDWIRPEKKDQSEPDFELLDNPERWNDFI